MKKRNEARQVRRSDPALDVRKHKRPFLGPEFTPAGKMAEKKRIRKWLPSLILQLNVEGLTASKLDIVERLATQHNVTIILLQETHCQTMGKLVINNYELAGYIVSRRHAPAVLVRNNLSWKISDSSGEDSDIDWQCINVEGYNIINIYKPHFQK